MGTERSVLGTTYTTFSEDLSFAQGDTLELWVKSGHAVVNAYIEDFRVLGAETYYPIGDAIVAGSVGLDDPFVGANS